LEDALDVLKVDHLSLRQAQEANAGRLDEIVSRIVGLSAPMTRHQLRVLSVANCWGR
jgi:hypothetical protein